MIGPFASPDDLGAAAAVLENTPYAQGVSEITLNPTALAAGLKACALAATAPFADPANPNNFNLSPNKFLNEGDATRILYRREL